ncbi:CYTH domain [Trypanosoma melophagium]|uniref:CYTH domain n=1 Tax=Trypanosoma melophagium TaxID=715481 RepID=UPI00351A6DFA|nr:CYTH domain [Trypanosoma melophagium]
MQVDAKILLQDYSDYECLTKALQSQFLHKEHHTDYFFDFPTLLLARRDTVLRLRVPCDEEKRILTTAAVTTTTTNASSDTAHSASLTLKDHSKVECGEQMFGFLQEKHLQEEVVKEVVCGGDIVRVLRQHCINANKDTKKPVAKIIRELESIAEEAAIPLQLQLVGSYTTIRKVYRYIATTTTTTTTTNGGNTVTKSESEMKENDLRYSMRIRVDETVFPFGKMYEIEIPAVSVPLSDIMEEIVNFLQSLNLKYSMSLESKYMRFMKYTQGRTAYREDNQELRLQIIGIDGYKEVITWLKSAAEGPEPISITQNSTQHSYKTRSPSPLQSYDMHSQAIVESDRLITGSTREGVTQTFGGFAQRTTQAERECSRKRNRDDDNYEEEYQENYYFDDAPDGTLMLQDCFLRLRCVNRGSSFCLTLKEKQKISYGSQNCFKRRIEISGDLARQLLCDPKQFLHTQREHNGIAKVLWEEFGLRNLICIAFFRTQRTIFHQSVTLTGPSLSQGHSYPQSPSLSQQQQQEERSLFAEPASLHAACDVSTSLWLRVDRTWFDVRHPAEQFAAAAGADPSCSPGGSRPPHGAGVTEMYELTVDTTAGGGHCNSTHTVGQQTVRAWLTEALEKRGVEWRPATQSKGEQYADLAAARLRRTSEERGR